MGGGSGVTRQWHHEPTSYGHACQVKYGVQAKAEPQGDARLLRMSVAASHNLQVPDLHRALLAIASP